MLRLSFCFLAQLGGACCAAKARETLPCFREALQKNERSMSACFGRPRRSGSDSGNVCAQQHEQASRLYGPEWGAGGLEGRLAFRQALFDRARGGTSPWEPLASFRHCSLRRRDRPQGWTPTELVRRVLAFRMQTRCRCEHRVRMLPTRHFSPSSHGPGGAVPPPTASQRLGAWHCKGGRACSACAVGHAGGA